MYTLIDFISAAGEHIDRKQVEIDDKLQFEVSEAIDFGDYQAMLVNHPLTLGLDLPKLFEEFLYN
jgi:hypothetical protein